MRWTETTTMKFLYRYQRHECLWNPKHKFFNVRKLRESAYKDIVRDMQIIGLDVKAVKVKIKNMRAQYFTELKKVHQVSQLGQHYEPSLYWYKEFDLFLGPISQDNPALQSTEMITADSIFDSSHIYENEDAMGKATPIFHQPEKTVRPNPLPPSHLRLALQTPPSAPNRVAGVDVRKRKRTYNKRRKPTGDEFETFGVSVAAQLRKLSVSRALKAQSRIQTILTEERIKDMETTRKPTEDEVQPIPFHPATSMHNNNNQFLQPIPFLPATSTHNTNPFLQSIPFLLAAPAHNNNQFRPPMSTTRNPTDEIQPISLLPDTFTHNNNQFQPPTIVENNDADSTSSGFNESNSSQKSIVSNDDSSNSGALGLPSPPTMIEHPSQGLSKAIKEIEDIKSKYSIQSDLIIKPEYEIITLDEEDPLADL